MVKSPDAFRTISEVAEWLDRPTHVLRFWESKFPQIKPVKRAGGRRYYRPQDMQLLGGIKRLLHDDGLTIKGVQKILREQGIAHVVALSQPLDDDLAARLAEDAAAIRLRNADAPMASMAEDGDPDADEYLFHDTVETADGGRVVQFGEAKGRGLPPPPTQTPPPQPDLAPVTQTDPADLPQGDTAASSASAAPKVTTAAQAQETARSDAADQPSLPIDLPPNRPETPPPATATQIATDPVAVTATETATETTSGSAAAPSADQAPPATSGVLSLVVHRTTPLPAANRAALIPLVKRLVSVARRLRAAVPDPE